MQLTKDDLAAIRGIVGEELTAFEVKMDEKFELLRNAMKALLKTQVAIVDKIDESERNVKLLMHHASLSEESRELRTTLKKLD